MTKRASPGRAGRLQRPSASVFTTSRPFDTMMPPSPVAPAASRPVPSMSSKTVPLAVTASPAAGVSAASARSPNARARPAATAKLCRRVMPGDG